ncbi:MAG TPA: hypothetical protein VF897_24105 [Roseiflexaceae bacterium]
MSSEPAQQEDGSFIVRIWWERNDNGAAGGRWRGWVQHVRSGDQIYFASLRDLTDFISHETGVHPADDRESHGLA